MAKLFLKTWTPERRQGEHAECGLAALGIAMGFHGVHVPLHQLRREAGSTLYGSTARTLRDLARRHGFAATAHRVEPEDMAALGFPLVAHSRFIHFVVVEKITSAGIHINDPVSGPEIVDPERFSQDFTGIVIRLAPGAPPKGKAYSALRHYWHSLAGEHPRLGAATGLTMLGAALLSGAIALFASAASSALAGDFGIGWSWPLLLVLAALTDIAALSLVSHAATGAARRGSLAILAEVPNWPASVFLLRNSGQAVSRVAAPLALDTPLPLVAALAALYLCVILAAGILVAPPYGLALAGLSLLQVMVLLTLWLRRGGAIARYGQGTLPRESFPRGLFAHPDWWQVGQGGQNLFTRLAGRHALAASHALRAASAQIGLDGALRLLDLVKYGVLVVLLLRAETGTMAGNLLGLLALAGVGNLALQRIARGLHVLPLKNALHRLADQIEGPQTIAPTAATGSGLELKDASWRVAEVFSPVFSPVSAMAAPGQVLALSGGADAATTALARLCAGLLPPHQGAVLLDGVPLAAMPAGTAILLDHHTAIRAGTVRENLTLGSNGLTDAALQEALDAVDLWHALAPRGGLDLQLDEYGSVLSGGQLRRLSLARALSRSPQILVLDGTLDSIEAELARSIVTSIKARRIVLVLTSMRPETLALADRHLTLRAAA